MDNGPEFISKALDGWTYFNHIQLDYSGQRTPTDNAIIESFNGSFRDECLNTNWFLSLADARDKIGRWKDDYNELRPHFSLTYLTPADFARKRAEIAVYYLRFLTLILDQFLGAPHGTKLCNL